MNSMPSASMVTTAPAVASAMPAQARAMSEITRMITESGNPVAAAQQALALIRPLVTARAPQTA
ncbi:hypothetical protein AB0H73_14845 [Streptomyces olivoreticuli]